jgi:hypothetical protein
VSNPNENTLDLQNDTDLLSELEPDWRSAPVGVSVLANDGQTIGAVRAKADDGLFVESAIQGEDEFFVTPADIASVEPGSVKLVIASSEVMRARPETAADASQGNDTASQQPS